MASFKNCFLEERSAFGNRACMASRAVLKTSAVSANAGKWKTGRKRNPLLRNRHEVLRTEVITKSRHEVIVARVRVHARSSKGVDGCRHGESRHRPLFVKPRSHRWSKSSLRTTAITTEHIHSGHDSVPRRQRHHWWHHAVHAARILIRHYTRHRHLPAIV